MWIERKPGTTVRPAELGVDEMIEFQLDGDTGTHTDLAGQLMWRDGEGSIARYRRLIPEGVGDVNGAAPGTAARFNAGKPALELIPAGILAQYVTATTGRPWVSGAAGPDWAEALRLLGDFQMRVPAADARRSLLLAAHALNHDGLLWADCARVFDYGRAKYSAWNWARGQAWSVPIGSALRHIVLGAMRGEVDDPESKLPHRGHVACNIVMLLWFLDHWREGDDRPSLSFA